MADVAMRKDFSPLLFSDGLGRSVGSKKNLSFASMDSLGALIGQKSSFGSFESLWRRKRCSSRMLNSLPSVSKRQKLIAPSGEQVRKVCERLIKAVSSSDRLSAIGAALGTFDHDNSSAHDEEIEVHGVDAALVKHLSLLIFKQRCLEERKGEKTESISIANERLKSLKEEIAYSCSALEMVYRCKASTLAESFKRVGGELLDILLFVMNEGIDRNEERDKLSGMEGYNSSVSFRSSLLEAKSEKRFFPRSSEFLLSKATKILCHLARVGLATEPIARHPGVLELLKSIIEGFNNDRETSRNDAQINSLWILANLACAPGNMVLIASHPNMLNKLLDVINFCEESNAIGASKLSCSNESVAARGQAVRVILNLSWKEENKVRMSEMPSLIKTLSQLVSLKEDSRQGRALKATLSSTKCHALGSLRNISSLTQTRCKLVLCQDDHLLQALVNTLQYSEDNDADACEGDIEVRKRSITAFYNLCCKETAHILMAHPNLVDNLTRLAEKNGGVIGNFAKSVLERINDLCDHKMVNLESTEELYVDEGSVDGESITEVNPEIPFRGKILKHLPHLDI